MPTLSPRRDVTHSTVGRTLHSSELLHSKEGICFTTGDGLLTGGCQSDTLHNRLDGPSMANYKTDHPRQDYCPRQTANYKTHCPRRPQQTANYKTHCPRQLVKVEAKQRIPDDQLIQDDSQRCLHCWVLHTPQRAVLCFVLMCPRHTPSTIKVGTLNVGQIQDQRPR